MIKANENPLMNSWGKDGKFKLGYKGKPNDTKVRPAVGSMPPEGFSPWAQQTRPSAVNTRDVLPDMSAYTGGEINQDVLNAFMGLTPQHHRDIASVGYDVNNDGQIQQNEYNNFHWDTHGQFEGRQQSVPTPQPQPTPRPTPTPQPSAPPPNFVAPPQPTPTVQPTFSAPQTVNPFEARNRYVKNPFMMEAFI